MSYVDGFVIAVPKKNVAAYKKMATWGKKMWMKHGALRFAGKRETRSSYRFAGITIST